MLLNALGRYLLSIARQGRFRDLIAKEGRKYGLTTVIATQRPRDVPQDVLSQLGKLFIHRLTNDRDRETIERACGDLDRSAAAFIPSLSQGEAIIVGPDLPALLPITMTKPEKGQQLESHGLRYQEQWGLTCSGNTPDADLFEESDS